MPGNPHSGHRERDGDDAWRPSLLVELEDPDARGAGRPQPVRMLDALEPGRAGAAGRRGVIRRWPWVAAASLAVLAGVSWAWQRHAPAPGERAVAQAPARAPMPAAVPAAMPAPQPSGPAQVDSPLERAAPSLPGMAPAPGSTPQADAAAVAPARPDPARSPARPARRHTAPHEPGHTAAAGHPSSRAPAATPAPRAAATANRPTGSQPKPAGGAHRPATRPAPPAAPPDPDAELVAAIMARSSGERVAPARAEAGPTIAALVRDCQALRDAQATQACRRRICDGYWGKAQACPRGLAPEAAAATAGAHAAGLDRVH